MMKRMSVIVVCLLLSFAFLITPPAAAQECSEVQCPGKTHCVEGSSFECTDICPAFSCAVDNGVVDGCASNPCASNQICLPNPDCSSSSCNKYRCLSPADYVCSTAKCPSNSLCVPSPKRCFTTPCPQYDCVVQDDSDPCAGNTCIFGQICIAEPKQCFTTPCPQFACLSQKECPTACAKDFNPVCGSDDNTYANECLLRRAMCEQKRSIYVQYRGECLREAASCPNICTANYDPVCGTDDHTYSNLCSLKVAACQQKTQISVAKQGECDACNVACTMEYAPVCGSDGATYGNECSLKAKACTSKSNLSVQYKGECQTLPCPEFCPMIYEPVCGSNDKTYENKCVLEVEACKTKSSIQVAHEGTCEVECTTMCTMEYAPVCGNNKMTYGNPCFLESARCLSKNSFDQMHQGECFTWASLQVLDTNHNGAVSKEEFAKGVTGNVDEAFSVYDRNHDGSLTSDDFASVTQTAVMNSRKAVTGVSVTIAILLAMIVGLAGYLFYKRKSTESSAQNRAAERSNKDISGNYERFNDSL